MPVKVAVFTCGPTVYSNYNESLYRQREQDNTFLMMNFILTERPSMFSKRSRKSFYYVLHIMTINFDFLLF